jgi:hypothetical protein
MKGRAAVAEAALRRSHRGEAISRSDGAGRMRSGIVSLVYLVVGVVIASSHHYFEHASTLKPLLSALLAIGLWPLLLVGINLHIK